MKSNKMMKLLLMVMVAALVLAGCAKDKEGIVVQVDGHQISQEEFDKDFKVYADLYERQLGEGALDEEGIDGKTLGESLKESIIEKLIMEKLIEEDSKNKEIELTEQDLQDYIAEYKESIGGEESYQQFLQSNNLSEDYFVENMRKELVVENHKNDFLEDVTVSQDDAKGYFQDNSNELVEVNASHILLGTEEKAKEIIGKLDAGEDFAQLAKVESLDSVSAINGGNLGYFGKGQMIPEFEEAAFSLDEGEISDIVKTEVGYHIILVQDKRDSFEDLQDKIISMIKEQEYFDYIQSLRDEAAIENYLD